MAVSQRGVDDWAPGSRPPRARRSDPLASHAAADALESSGRAASLMADVLDAVRRFPGLTSRELGLRTGIDRHDFGRRLPELERRRLIERVEEDPGAELRCWETGKAPRNLLARTRAIAGFRNAKCDASSEDLSAAAALELRVLSGAVAPERAKPVLQAIYSGRRVARLDAQGLVHVAPPTGVATSPPTGESRP